jgi:hypothetical protein
VTEKQKARIENDYIYHPPFGDQVGRYQNLRDAVRLLAEKIIELTPESREQSVALTHLDITMMMANAAIARNEKP